MMQWTDAENWIDLIDHIWIGLVLVAVAGIPSYFSAKNGKGIKKLADNVSNGHENPMREDLDQVILSMSTAIDKIDALDYKVSQLSADLEVEERRRSNSDVQLRDDFDRRFSDFISRFLR